jgi:hypothetical protein
MMTRKLLVWQSVPDDRRSRGFHVVSQFALRPACLHPTGKNRGAGRIQGVHHSRRAVQERGPILDGGDHRARDRRCAQRAPIRPRRRVCVLRRCGDLHAQQGAADGRPARRADVRVERMWSARPGRKLSLSHHGGRLFHRPHQAPIFQPGRCLRGPPVSGLLRLHLLDLDQRTPNAHWYNPMTMFRPRRKGFWNRPREGK